MNPLTARLFVAVELPERIRAALSDWGRAALGEDPVLRPVRTPDLHATLCFLGSQPLAARESIWSACICSLEGFHAPRVRTGEPRWLPARRPRVLAALIDDPEGALGSLQAALATALAAGGWYQSEARLLPHVTVARVRHRQRPRRRELPPPVQAEFTVSAVTLFRSRSGAEGARYEALESLALAAS